MNQQRVPLCAIAMFAVAAVAGALFVSQADAAATINFNFATSSGTGITPNDPMDAAETAGAPDYASPNWNNLYTDWSGNGGAVPSPIVDSAGGDVTALGLGLYYDTSNCWNTGIGAATGDQKMMRNYLDSNSTDSPAAMVSGVPYRKFDVVVYADGDQGAGGLDGPYVLRYGTGTGAVQYGWATEAGLSTTNLLRAPVWLKETGNFDGSTYTAVSTTASTSVAAAQSGNYMVFTGIKGDFTIDPSQTTNASGVWLSRAPLNGFQIVQWETATTLAGAGPTDKVALGGAEALAADLTIGSLATKGDVIISPGVLLTLANGDLDVGDVNHWIQGGGSITSSTNTLTINRDISVGAGYATGATDAAINNASLVDNAGTPLDVVKTGAGILRLYTAQNYTGTTTINGGVLQLTSGNDRLPTGTTLTVNGGPYAGGTLDLYGQSQTVLKLSGGAGAVAGAVTNNAAGTTSTLTVTGTSQFDGVLRDGAGKLALTKSDGGTLVLTGANTFSGNTTINAATIQITNPLALQNSTVVLAAGGGTLDLGGLNAVLGGLSGDAALDLGSITLTVGNGNGSSAFAGNLTGSGTLVKTGAGTLELSGSNSVTGGVVINAGSVQFDTAAAMGAGRSVLVNAGATAAAGYGIDQGFLDHLATTSLGAVALAADSGANLDFSALPNAVLGSMGDHSYSGTITPYQHVARLGGGSGILTLSGPNSIANDSSLVVAGGTVRMTAASAYSGATTVNGGALRLAAEGTILNNANGITLNGSGGSAVAFYGAALPLGGLFIDDSGSALADTDHFGSTPIAIKGGTLGYYVRLGGGSTTVADVTAVSAATLAAYPAGGNANLVIGNLTRQPGATVNFLSQWGALGSGTGDNGSIHINNLDGSPMPAGFIGGWATVGPNFATYDPANGVQANVPNSSDLESAGPTDDFQGSGHLSSSKTIRSAISTGDVLLDNNSTLTLASGGLIFGGGNHYWYYGSVTSATNELTITVDPASGVHNDKRMYSTVIADNGGQPLTLVKSGTGQLMLNTYNTYTGPTLVNAGTLVVATSQNGSGVGCFTPGSTVTVAPGATLRVDGSEGLGWPDAAGGPQTPPVVLDGGAMVINNAYVAVGKLTMSGGVITINNGMTMALHGDPTAGPNQGFISVPASANPSVINGPGGLYLRNSFGANKTFDVGGSLVINAPISSQGAVTLTKSGAGTLVIGNIASRVSSAVVSGGTLQTPAPAMTGPVTLQNDANITFDGAGSFDQGIAGAGSVAKIGSGELVVGGQNSYTGATAINAGTLTLSRSVAGVVAHLAFDETAGTTAQNSANPSLNGTISASGVAVNQPGKVGAAYQFTASSDGQVVVPTDASLNSATGTWSMWINTSLPLAGPGSDEAAMLIDRRAATGNIWGINSSGHLYIQTSGGAASFAGNTNVADGQWHQVMLTWNTAAGSDQTYYVDGVADGTQTAGAAWVFDNRQLEIGKSHDNYWKRFNGLMDDVYVFNRALSADEAGLFYSVSSGTVASVDYLPDTSAVAVAAGATLNVNGLAETIGPLSGQGAVTLGGGALTINSSDGTNGVDSVFAGSVTGAGNLVKIGAGKLTLAGPNSYLGGTLVQAGVLEIAASDALPNGGALTIGADGPLALAGGATAAAGSSMAGPAVTQAASPAAVPEPGTMLLLAAGALAALAMGLRRKFR